MSAMDVTCKRQSEFGVNMPLLIRSFDPELIGALWEGKIAEDHTGIKEQYPEVFSAIMPKSLLETAGNTEQTTEIETAQMPSAKKKRGKKSAGKTEPEGQLSLHLEEENRKQVREPEKAETAIAQEPEVQPQDEPAQVDTDRQIKRQSRNVIPEAVQRKDCRAGRMHWNRNATECQNTRSWTSRRKSARSATC